MPPTSKRVVIRAQRIHYLGCCGGCFIPVVAAVAFGIRMLLDLSGRSSQIILGAGMAVSLLLGIVILWFFFNDVQIARVWNQKFVFDSDLVRFRDMTEEHELRYSQIRGLRVHQTEDGPSQELIIECEEYEPTTITCKAHDYSPEAVMKILREFSLRVGLDSIAISRLLKRDNGQELKSAAKNIGAISFDESSNCYWFTPLK